MPPPLALVLWWGAQGSILDSSRGERERLGHCVLGDRVQGLWDTWARQIGVPSTGVWRVGAAVVVHSQGVFALRWCSSGQSSAPSHDHHSPGLPRLFGEHRLSLCRCHQPPCGRTSFLVLLSCPSPLTGSDLCRGTLPSVAGKLAGQVGRAGLSSGRGSWEQSAAPRSPLFPAPQHLGPLAWGSPPWGTERVGLE